MKLLHDNLVAFGLLTHNSQNVKVAGSEQMSWRRRSVMKLISLRRHIKWLHFSLSWRTMLLVHRPVAPFQDLVGHNTFLGGQDFCFYYMFKTNFSERNKIWGAQKKFGVHCPRMPPWLRACWCNYYYYWWFTLRYLRWTEMKRWGLPLKLE